MEIFTSHFSSLEAEKGEERLCCIIIILSYDRCTVMNPPGPGYCALMSPIWQLQSCDLVSHNGDGLTTKTCQE